ncbi:IgGFc-binding protein-like [Onthophagus taurus]|uniref:IgGFc-binding protein-like n=1 Tax=Onthophagus taurus TaxID=166361 RepID=UPI0039BDD1C5
MDSCISDFCDCKLAKRNDCMCGMLDAFARTCQNNIKESISWRSDALCPIRCNNAEQEFLSCAPNKAQLSCGEEEVDTTNLSCEEGCYCPNGLRLFGDKCYIQEECPCTYNDNVYNTGLSITQDCNTCVCKMGKWSCTNKQCYVDGKCSGDPHYRTFDGKAFDFMGKCSYYVVRGTGFDVICDHYLWKGFLVKDFQSTLPSFCAKVIVQVKEDRIDLGQKHDIQVNSNKLNWFPFNSPSFFITKPSNLLTTVTLQNSVIVEWNGASALTVKIPTSMKGRVKGLFGTYTKNQTDDFLMPNGEFAKDPTTFGNSWKVPGSCENESLEPVPHPCLRNPAKKAKAEQSCALLKSLFDKSIDFTEEYENCLYDACLCPDEQKDCVCECYAEQAAKSAANGVLVDWRSKVPGCEIKCPAGQTYQICANSCTSSCEDIIHNPKCQKKCVEGCNCPEGTSLNSYGKCVPFNECNCVYIDARFAQDFTFIHEENKRICVNATWDVNNATDDDKKKYPNWDDLQQNCNADLYESYTGCMSANRVTCRNKHLNEQPLYGKCESGCQCMNGFVYDEQDSVCVRPEDCPCEHNGVSFLENDVRADRNEKCTCKDRFWECTQENDRWEKCTAWGNTHIRTFDELFYSFKGICEYTLLEDSDNFRVTLKTEKCNVGSCIKQASIYYKSTNNKEEKIVFTKDEKFTIIGELSNLEITDSNESVLVNVVNMGVKVIWDKTGLVHIHVSQQWKSRKNHGGLCGKFDDNPSNDLLTPNANTGVTHLVDYYTVDKTCSQCTEHMNIDIIPPQKTCDILYSEIFKTCNILTPFKEYYKRCLIDTNLQFALPESERFDHFCHSLSAYAQECKDLNIIVNWRTENICPLKPKLTCTSEGKEYQPGTSITQDCNTCTCQQGNWACTEKICYVDGKCSGDPHCKTFDGKPFDFMGKCAYYLVRGEGFDVICDHYIVSKGIFVKDFKSTLPSYCAKVIIKAKGETIELGQKHQVKVNDDNLSWFPFNSQSFYISKPSNLLTQVTLSNSVIVQWNGVAAITVKIPTTMKGQVKGLLGTYNKNNQDDFLMPNEKLANTATEFGNSWKVPGSCENEHLEPVPHPCLNNPDKKAKAEQSCALLKSGLFDGAIDSEEEYENCLYDACSCPDTQKDCVCEFYAAQSEKCAAKGFIVDWRAKVPGCEIKCPAGQIYQNCGNHCSRSCEAIATTRVCPTICIEGCYCPAGQTLDEFGKCVQIKQCKCIFEGKPYPADFTFIYKNSKWTCQNGNWNTTVIPPDDKTPSLPDLQKKCDANRFEEYCGCTRTNPLTCQNKHFNAQPLYGKCKAGCQCMNGYVYDTVNEKCVKPESCPCNYNGISYSENAVNIQKNEKCTCKGGNWECIPNTDRWEKCSIWSNTHIRTFDELIYSFSGICEYVLLEDNDINGLFRVTLKNEKCKAGACIKQVSVLYKDVNNVEEKIIFTNGKNYAIIGKLSNLVITESDLSVSVNVVKLGVKIIWDKSGWAHIHVSQEWKSRKNHGGLCGKYDDNPNNDLLTPNNDFGVTHLVDYYRVDNSCSKCTEHQDPGLIPPQNTCDILFNGIFKTCASLKPFKEYYKRCLIDVNLEHLLPKTQQQNHFCQSLAAYEQECIDLNLFINWRTKDICPIKSSLSCIYNDKEYTQGESINKDCNKCTCQKGKWACTEKTCYVDGKCSGDPHCKTFDGKPFDFMGKCAYYLVRGDGFDVICDHYVVSKGTFVKDFKSTLPSYCAKVIIKENGETIELGQKHRVKVNDDNLSWFPFKAQSGFYISKPSNLLTQVTLSNSVIVQWNGVAAITVKIPTTMKGQVKGLLGTYNINKQDDFLMPNEELAKTATQFGNSWKVPGSCENEHVDPVPHPCLSNPAKKANAEQACALLKSGLFDGAIDSEEEYENCLYDACSCPDTQKDCVCEFYAAQSEKCAAKGFIVDWRAKVPGCEIKCPAGQTYQNCGNQCFRSCESIATTRICPRICTEGCYCPVGQTLDEFGKCVQIKQCKCIFEGKPYPPDFTFIYKKSKWTCQNGNWNTTIVPPGNTTPSLPDLQKKCDANRFEEYSGCTRTNRLTCQNKHINEQPLYGKCKSGCQCMNGYVYDTVNKKCVKPESCPCNYNGISYLENAVKIQKNEKCTCKGGNWECIENTDHWEKCSVWSNTHIRTFDELIYSFSGICEYVLLEDNDINGLFRVTLKNEKCNAGACIKQVSVFYKDVNNVEEKIIFTNGENYAIIGKLSNFLIAESDLSVSVNVVKLGVKVIWDKSGWVHIHVSQEWKSRKNHGGLCGKYDDNAKNDLLTPNNDFGVTHLVDYYRVDNSCSKCTEHQDPGLIPPQNTCDILFNGIFKTCASLKPFKEYYKRCLIDVNLEHLLPKTEQQNRFCQSLAAYEQECIDLNLSINWRTKNICPIKSSLSCIYKDKEYTQGESINEDCNKCTCQKGKWACTEKTCYVDGKCSGDPHCKTFDGKPFDFMGKCAYYLVRGDGFDVICDHYVVSKGAFVKDFKSTLPSYCAKVIIKENGETIELGQKHRVKVNNDNLSWLPFNSQSGFYISKPSNLLTQVTLSNSVIVQWNGVSTVTVKIPTTMKGQVKGLLGTYNKNKEDDFLMPNKKVATTATQFGNSWKVPGSCENEHIEPTPHPCLNNPAKRAKAEQACALLKSGLFEAAIDSAEEYENCLYDACLCPDTQKDCVCEFYAAQSEKCAAKGFIVDWRAKVPGCEIKCPAGQTYQNCGNQCFRSCDAIATTRICPKICTEGCYCPVGETLDEFRKCVPITQCKCIFEGKPYPPDFTFIYKNSKWTCQNGKWTTTLVPNDDSTTPSLPDLQKKCDANRFEEYSGCTRTNRLSCKNKHLNPQPLYGKCKGGCQCMNGYVYDTENKKCVKPERCPCNYNGISYSENAVKIHKNEKCTCKGGNWKCTENTNHWEKCTVWSNTHIRTFDELFYSFSGVCEYVLLEDNDINGLFRVTLKTEKCNVGGCISQVSVLYKDINNKIEKITFSKGTKFVIEGELNRLSIKDMDLSIIVNVAGLGAKVVWNKAGWVHIHVSQLWKSQKNHGGLCGKYDDNPKNDLLTPDNKFGITHLVNYYRIDKSCLECNEHTNIDIIPPKKTCDILYNNIFKTCGTLKPIKEYYQRCLIDANLQSLLPENERFNYYCQTLSAYAQECNDINLPVNWRTDDICPQTCEPKKQYYPCQTSCPKRTCKDSKKIVCNNKLCSETCSVSCPANMIFKDEKYDQCVKEEECNEDNVCTQNVDIVVDNEENCDSTKIRLKVHTKKGDSIMQRYLDVNHFNED